MFGEWHQRYPLFYPTLAYGAGIYLASVWAGVGTYRVLLAYPFLVSLLSWLFFRHRPWRDMAAAALLFCLGLMRVGGHFFAPLPEPLATWVQSPTAVPVVFRIEDYGQYHDQRCSVPATLLRWDSRGAKAIPPWRVRLSLESSQCEIAPGEAYRAWLRFREPRNFKNPSSFDYARYLRVQDYSATAHVVTGLSRETGLDHVWAPQLWAARARARFIKILDRAEISPQARGVLAAMTLRYTRDLSLEIQDLFRRSGLSHLLVVSGLNFALILALVYFPVYFLLSLQATWQARGLPRPLALVMALFPTLLYGAVVGWTPPVLRSLAGVLLMAVAVIGVWRRHFFSLLLLTCFGLWLWDPLLLLDLSFQLSFVSVAAAARFSLECARVLKRRSELFWLWRALIYPLLLLGGSVAVNLALYPWFAEDFHEVSWVGPAANLVFIPFFSWWLMPGCLLVALLSDPLPGWALEILLALGRSVDWSLQSLRVLSNFAAATSFVAPLRSWQWGVYLLLLVAVFGFSRPRRGLAALFAALCLWGLGSAVQQFKVPPQEMRLSMFDVGQGESMLLTLPDGFSLMIDGGGLVFNDFDIGRHVLMPELLRLGVRRIDAVMLTHPDADHYKGLEYLLKYWEVGEFWSSEAGFRHLQLQKIREILNEKNIRLRFLKQGEYFSHGEVRLEVLWPPSEGVETDNDLSLVLRTCFHERCFLLTGDVESLPEVALTRAGSPLKSDTLKLAHHGSRSSTGLKFLDAVAPRLALASLGLDNRFHFPHSEVLERLSAQGIRLLRTDRDGLIEVWTDGYGLFDRTFAQAIGRRLVPSRWSAIQAVVFAGKS